MSRMSHDHHGGNGIIMCLHINLIATQPHLALSLSLSGLHRGGRGRFLRGRLEREEKSGAVQYGGPGHRL